MERMLEGMVIFVAKIHNYILSLNDAYEKNFTDKQLHFLVIGILGTMDFADIVFGIAGFLLMFVIFAVIRQIFLAIINLFRKIGKHQSVFEKYL